jgi:hypothetical protein
MARLVARTFLGTGTDCDVTVALVPTVDVDTTEEGGLCCGWYSSAWSDVSFSTVTLSAEAMPVSGKEGGPPLSRGSKGSRLVAMAVRHTTTVGFITMSQSVSPGGVCVFPGIVDHGCSWGMVGLSALLVVVDLHLPTTLVKGGIQSRYRSLITRRAS